MQYTEMNHFTIIPGAAEEGGQGGGGGGGFSPPNMHLGGLSPPKFSDRSDDDMLPYYKYMYSINIPGVLPGVHLSTVLPV